MSNNVKIALVALVLLAGSGIGLYFYFNSATYDLIREAESLYAEGELASAHEKAEEAMIRDPLNRRASVLKAEILFELTNETEYQNGLKAMEDAEAALRKEDYINASQAYYKAFDHFDNVSTRAKQYDDAQAMILETIRRERQISDNISEQYYNSAMRLYRNGELSRAFEYLQRAPRETEQIINLKSDIAYTLGLRRYDEIIRTPSVYQMTYYNDAIYWFKQVDANDPNFTEAQKMINTLTGMFPQAAQ